MKRTFVAGLLLLGSTVILKACGEGKNTKYFKQEERDLKTIKRKKA